MTGSTLLTYIFHRLMADLLSNGGKAEVFDRCKQLQVDLGYEKRQIVSGIAAFYKSEELIGKKVVVVANLPPRKMRGIESQGMILTAESEGKLSLLTADAESGSPVA